MKTISYARHRFPPDIIQHAIWLYLRFTLSYRDVEDLLAKRGLEITNETIRRWVMKFGSVVARNLRQARPAARYDRWSSVTNVLGRNLYFFKSLRISFSAACLFLFDAAFRSNRERTVNEVEYFYAAHSAFAYLAGC